MVKHYLSNWARMERHCSFSSGQHPIQSRQLRIRREGEKKKAKACGCHRLREQT
jgi:hypothetical protein